MAVDREDDLDDVNYQTREVFAQFGLTVYLAQVLERGVLNATVVAESAASGAPSLAAYEAAFDAAWARDERLTLGQLLKRFASATTADAALLKALAEGLDVRNRLAHSWFWTHAEDFISVVGREQMLAELMLMRENLQELDARVHEVVVAVMVKSGRSRQWIEEATALHAAEMHERARLRDEA